MALTKEEKKAKALAKRLARKQAIAEGKKKRKREELEREIAGHLLFRGNLDKAWRQAMLKIKEPLYREQFEVMRHTLDRAYDKKDALINQLMYLLNVANMQYGSTIANFFEIAYNIIETFLSDLENMCKKNDINTKVTLEHGRAELAYYLDDHYRAETHLKLMLYHGHNMADALAWNTRGDNAVRNDEDRSTNHEIRDLLTAVLEGTYVYIWDQYKATLKAYIVSTAENQKQLQILRKKENVMSNIIAAQSKQLIYYAQLIKNLRAELLAYDLGEKQAAFRDRRKRHKEAYFKLKKCMSQGLEIDSKQLGTLVRASDDTVQWLEAAFKKCDKIHRMVALCIKYETRREKVMPYGSETVHVSGNLLASDSSSCLNKLWHRMSRAELSKRALLREKMILERENAILELQLLEQNKEYVGPNAVRCACSTSKVTVSNSKPYAVDGTLEIKKYFIR